MNPEEFNQHLSDLLISRENKEELIQNLNTGIAEAQGDVTKLIEAWKPIVAILNKDYWVSRDDTKKFHKVSPVINSLELIVQECINAFTGKAAGADFMGELAQLHFKCSNYYSIASTLSPDNLQKCTAWLEKAGAFIAQNGLTDTRSDAVWHNLVGGHESRQFQMGLMKVHPESSVEHFRQAVRIQHDVLGNKVEDPKAVELRHVMMCLGSTLVQQAMSKALMVATKIEQFTQDLADVEGGSVYSSVLYAQLDKDLQRLTSEAHEVLSQLTEDNLVLADSKPDLYRRAGTKQFTGYLSLLKGDFDSACSLLDQAARDMENSLPVTGAKGQLSQILNDVAKMYDAKAAAVRLRSIELSKSDFEQMYADNAKHDLANTSSNPYSRLGEIVVRLNQRRALAMQSALSTTEGEMTLGTSSPTLLFQSHQQGSTSDEVKSAVLGSPKRKLGAL
jgi:hypothetical protein